MSEVLAPAPKKRISSRRKRRRQTIQISLGLMAGAALLYLIAVFFVIRPLAKRAPTAAQPVQQRNVAVRPGRAVPDSVIEQLRQSAVAGDARAQNDLGVLYQVGRSVGQDDIEAVRWYRRAAVRNSPLAQNNLGWMHEQGRGVERDYASALFWYKQAAQAGNVAAQHNLALLYERGLGLPPNRTLAAEWYERAVKLGDESARAGLERVSGPAPAEGKRPVPVDDAASAMRSAQASPGFLQQTGVKTSAER